MKRSFLSIMIIAIMLCSMLIAPTQVGAELTLTISNLAISQEHPLPNDVITVTGEIKNESSSDIANIDVSLYYGESSSISSETIHLAAGETKTITTNWTLPANLDNLVLTLSANDIKRTLNVKYEYVLSIQNVQANATRDNIGTPLESVKAKNIFSGSATVINSGNKAIDATTLDILLSGDTSILNSPVSVNTLNPRESTVVNFTTLPVDTDLDNKISTIFKISQDATELLSTNIQFTGYIRPIANSIEVYEGPTLISDKLNITIGTSKTLDVKILPQYSENTIAISSLSPDIFSVTDNTINALQLGSTTLEIVTSPDNIKRRIMVNVLPVMLDTELLGISLFSQNTPQDVLVPINLNTDFTYNSYYYTVDIDESIKNIKVAYTKQEGIANSNVTLSTGKDNSTFTPLDSDTFSVSGRTNLILRVVSGVGNPFLSDYKETKYDILINNVPIIEDTFPTVLTIYKDLPFEMYFTNMYLDPEKGDKLQSIEVTDEFGNRVGSIETDPEKTVYSKFWHYVSNTLGTKNLIFTFIDNNNGKSSRTIPVTTAIDTECPTWSSNNDPRVNEIYSNSATVNWQYATDNDKIDSYTVYYWNNNSNIHSVTVQNTLNFDCSTRITNLYSGVKYTVRVEAIDRSGNVITSTNATFTTAVPEPTTDITPPPVIIQTNPPVATPTPTPIPEKKVFVDLQDYEWANPAIVELYNNGIIKGTSADTFSPELNITRGDFLLLIMNTLNLGVAFDGNFYDVPTDSYYYNAIGMAKSLGLATGRGDNNFYPNDPITRQDMMTLTYRVLAYLNKLSSSEPPFVFADEGNISDYAMFPIYSLLSNGIVIGDDNKNINPKNYTLRAEAAVLIHRIWKNK